MIAKEREYHPHFGEVPQSKGVPTGLLLTVAIGIAVIFAIGAGVIVNSHYGHMWPSMTTLREPLKK
jgi:hypothetical protein